MLPKVNEFIYMQVNSIDEEEARQEYKARIAEIHDNYISMEIPLHVKTGKLKRVFVGDEMNAYFITEGGVKNHFQTTVLGFKEDVVRLVVIKRPDEESITRVQRRTFLRVPADLEVAIKVTEQIKFTALTEDVGGGGVSFVCDGYLPVKQRDEISCWLLITYRNGVIDHAFFKGEVVRIKPLENGKQLAMVQFSEIADIERQKIIRFCFERQLDFRKQ
jgi:c-di-GMP-binding flagellar brake protein YcgR